MTLICKMCHLFIGEHRFSANLFVLLISEFDVILGMDWLTKYQAMVEYYRRRVILQKKSGQVVEFQAQDERFVFAPVLKSLLGGRCNMERIRILFALDEEIGGESADSFILVVTEFLDVFPLELPRLLPEREIKFCINLVPGTSPVLIAPYRMAPDELAELRTQLDDLLDKGLSSRALLRGEHPFFLSRSMMGPYDFAWIIASLTRSP